MIATNEGHSEIVELILMHPKTDVNRIDSEGKSSLFFACQRGEIEVI